MPVHWYYFTTKIQEDFDGWIEKYEQPKESHPSPSTLSLPKPGKITQIASSSGLHFDSATKSIYVWIILFRSKTKNCLYKCFV